MLNLHQLFLFKKVVESDGYTAASEQLHISQPSISIQVKRLEKELNLSLFERIGNKLHLTQYGEYLYDYACRIINLAEEAEGTMKNLQNLKGGKIRIGASTTPGIYLLPSIAAEFKRVYPEIEIKIEIANTRKIEEKLSKNEIDLAILGEEQEYDSQLVIEPFVEDFFVLACNPTHNLVNKTEVKLHDIANEKFVMREKGSSTRDFVDLLFDKNDLFYKEVWELPSTESIKQVLLSGWGISILSYLTVRTEVEAGLLKTVPLIHNSSVHRKINLAYHKGKKFSPALKLFYTSLKDNIDKY